MIALISNESIIEWGGFAIIIALVYIETGFLVGLVVPGGETLLFTAGLLAGTNTFELPIYVMIPILIIAAILGDITGYYIGNKLGKKLHEKDDTWYFKKRYLEKAEDFYEEKGVWALVLGRFLPVVRTLNPVLTGSGKMEFKRFILYVVIGVILYITSLMLLGYFIGNQIPWIKDYLKYILPAIVIIAIAPVVWKFYKER